MHRNEESGFLKEFLISIANCIIKYQIREKILIGRAFLIPFLGKI
jgi:hypothetical protein